MRNRARIIIGLCTFVAVVFIVWFIILVVNKPPERLTPTAAMKSSDVVLSNVGFSSIENGKFSFFTGSNIATTDFTNGLVPGPTKTQFNETSFDEVRSIQYDGSSKTLYASVRYTAQNPFFKLSPSIKPGIVWVTQKQNTKPKAIQFFSNGDVVDAVFDKNVAYGLLYKRDGENTFFMYDLDEKKSEKIKDTDGTKIVGINNENVLLQDKKGGVIKVSRNNNKFDRITKKGMGYSDSTTGSVVATNINIEDSETKYSATIYTPGKKDKKIPLEYETTFVSNGFIINSDNNYNPNVITTTNISDGVSKKYSISRSNDRLKDTVTDLLVIQKNPLTLAAITSSNQLYLISEDASSINKITPYKFPVITAYSGSGIDIDGSGITNTVTISSNPEQLDESLALIKNSCAGCDINQLEKIWVLLPED